MLSILVSELGDGFGCTRPRDTRSSAVHVASFAFETPVVTNEQEALLSQFVHHLPSGRPCSRFFSDHQGFEFADVAYCTTFCPYVCLYQRQTFRDPDSDTFSLFWALRSRFKSGSSRLANSSATTSAKEFASTWWKPILFCVVTDGPTSSPSVTWL